MNDDNSPSDLQPLQGGDGGPKDDLDRWFILKLAVRCGGFSPLVWRLDERPWMATLLIELAERYYLCPVVCTDGNIIYYPTWLAVRAVTEGTWLTLADLALDERRLVLGR